MLGVETMSHILDVDQITALNVSTFTAAQVQETSE